VLHNGGVGESMTEDTVKRMTWQGGKGEWTGTERETGTDEGREHGQQRRRCSRERGGIADREEGHDASSQRVVRHNEFARGLTDQCG
jgi:hypothetical protein